MTIKPYYQSDRVTLYHGDCLAILPTLGAGSVDAVVTDPPYGIGFKYNQHNDTPDGYGDWIWSVISLAESKLTTGSPVFVWQSMTNATHFSAWFPRKWRIFAACKNFVQIRPTAMQFSFDPVLVWWTGGKAAWFSKIGGSRDFHVADTTPSTRRKNGEKVDGHPCPRPLSQVRHVVEQWVKPDGTVIDPFTGSGTTGVACVKTGRKFIGIEIDEKYCEIAAKRIQDAERECAERLVQA